MGWALSDTPLDSRGKAEVGRGEWAEAERGERG